MSEQIRVRSNRAIIIESLCAEPSQTEIIRVFVYPRLIVYDVTAKYLASETSEKYSANLARKSHLKEKSIRTPAIIERAQELVSEELGLFLMKLAKTLGVSDTTMC